MVIERVRLHLLKIPGVLSVDPLDDEIYQKVLQLEERYSEGTKKY